MKSRTLLAAMGMALTATACGGGDDKTAQTTPIFYSSSSPAVSPSQGPGSTAVLKGTVDDGYPVEVTLTFRGFREDVANAKPQLKNVYASFGYTIRNTGPRNLNGFAGPGITVLIPQDGCIETVTIPSSQRDFVRENGYCETENMQLHVGPSGDARVSVPIGGSITGETPTTGVRGGAGAMLTATPVEVPETYDVTRIIFCVRRTAFGANTLTPRCWSPTGSVPPAFMTDRFW